MNQRLIEVRDRYERARWGGSLDQASQVEAAYRADLRFAVCTGAREACAPFSADLRRQIGNLEEVARDLAIAGMKQQADAVSKASRALARAAAVAYDALDKAATAEGPAVQLTEVGT